MSTTTSDLLNRANIIKNETLEGKNSAVRVGSLFWDIISKMEGNTSKLSTLEELINSGGSRYSNVRVTPVYTNGVLIATIRVGVQDYAIYAPGKGGSGSDSDSDGYDDRELRREIDLIKSNLDNILEREKAGIKDMVEEILAGKNFISGWQAGWYETLKSYLISVGVLGADGVSKGWAYLDTKYNDLEAAVNSLRRIGEDNQGLYETLQSQLNLFIQNEFGELSTAVGELKTRYALTADDKTVLKWLTAQLRVQAGANGSLAQLFATASDKARLQDALALLEARVDDIEGNYVSTARLIAQVRNEIDGRISTGGLITTASLDRAVTTLFAESGDNTSSARAAIDLIVENGISSIVERADIIQAIANRIVIDGSQIDITADQINAAMESLRVKVSDIIIGDGKRQGSDYYDRMLIHTYKEPGSDKILGMELLFGNFQINNAGDVTMSKPGLRCRFNYYYLDAPKIVSSQIMLPTQNLNGPSYLDFNKDSVIRWFNTVGNPETNQTGDEYGIDANGNMGTNETDGAVLTDKSTVGNSANGYITFEGDTIVIHGNLKINDRTI